MYFLPDNNQVFPHPLLSDEEGVLALSESFDAEMLKTAYSFGLFPWYNDYPVYWWYTHPRCVLLPKDLRIHKSMRPYFNQEKYRVSFNQAFNQVIHHCKEVKRKGQESTWLNEKLIANFTTLHQEGICQSVEVWEGQELVGGLYGLRLGKIFFGESMFALKPNASKFGFISLVQKLEKEGIVLIDCQQETAHLMSLGAHLMDKMTFWSFIRKNLLDILRE